MHRRVSGLGLAISVVLCGVASCSSPESSTRTFVVKGSVSTGAHTRAPVSGGYVHLLKPKSAAYYGAWAGLSFASLPSTGTIHADGSYRFTIERWAMDFDDTNHVPVFIAASDSAQTLTMLAEIPLDLSVEGAELTIDINPSTTFASQMICPGGIYPPPANTWCYSDPKTPSVDKTALLGIVDGALGGHLISLEPGAPPHWDTFAAGFLNDPATFTAIKDHLTASGVAFGAATPATIASVIASAALPRVPAPGGGSSSGGTSSGGASSGGAACKLVWDCGTSSQCATVYGAAKGSASQPDASTCQSTCKAQGACTCQGC